jgi:hypothetical protein
VIDKFIYKQEKLQWIQINHPDHTPEWKEYSKDIRKELGNRDMVEGHGLALSRIIHYVHK